jgi:hypothetical protein
MRRRTPAYLVIAVAALAVLLEALVVTALGTRAPAWSHWICSPSTAHSSRHVVLGGGAAGTVFGTSLRVLAVHWPHLVPIPVGLVALVYLRRANVRYRASETS